MRSYIKDTGGEILSKFVFGILIAHFKAYFWRYKITGRKLKFAKVFPKRNFTLESL